MATGVLEITDKKGDTKLIWDHNKQDEVDAAEELFNSLKAKRYMAYKVVGKDGTKGEVIHKFDRNEERIIMTPQPVGG